MWCHWTTALYAVDGMVNQCSCSLLPIQIYSHLPLPSQKALLIANGGLPHNVKEMCFTSCVRQEVREVPQD